MYIYIFTWVSVCVSTSTWQPEAKVGSLLQLLYFLRQHLSLNLAHQFISGDLAMCSRDPLVFALPLPHLNARLQCAAGTGLYIGAGDPNPSPHACKADSLLSHLPRTVRICTHDKKLSERSASADPSRPSSLSPVHSKLLGWLRAWEHKILLISTCNPNHFSLGRSGKWLRWKCLWSRVSKDPFAFFIHFSFFCRPTKGRGTAQKEDSKEVTPAQWISQSPQQSTVHNWPQLCLGPKQ